MGKKNRKTKKLYKLTKVDFQARSQGMLMNSAKRESTVYQIHISLKKIRNIKVDFCPMQRNKFFPLL